jgi:hypothetical protein
MQQFSKTAGTNAIQARSIGATPREVRSGWAAEPSAAKMIGYELIFLTASTP